MPGRDPGIHARRAPTKTGMAGSNPAMTERDGHSPLIIPASISRRLNRRASAPFLQA